MSCVWQLQNKRKYDDDDDVDDDDDDDDSSIYFSSPNLSRRRLDVYHTSTHGVALVRI